MGQEASREAGQEASREAGQEASREAGQKAGPETGRDAARAAVEDAGLGDGAAPRVFFTADSHFGHRGILRLAGRPFADLDEMDEALVGRWNARVRDGDRVYHLGDFCLKGSKLAAAMLARLNGDIVLLRGNHDSANTARLDRWASVHDLLELTLDRVRLVLCHYPLLEWPGAYRGALHLHGHTHGAVPANRQRVDVGVDVWEYRPVNLAEIAARAAEAAPYDPKDAYSADRR